MSVPRCVPWLGLVAALVVASPAYAALPQCSDGIDNDGDGQIDFNPGAEGLFATADTDCRSPSWNSELSGSDLGNEPFDGGVDASASADGGIPPGETCDASNSCNMFVHPDGGTVAGSSGGSGDATHDPPRHGCDVGGPSPATLPILLLLGTGCGLALLSRRTRT